MNKDIKNQLIALLINIVYFGIFWGIHKLFGTEFDTYTFLIGNLVLWVSFSVTINLMSLFRRIFKLELTDGVPLVTNMIFVVIITLSSVFFIAWQTQIAMESLVLWKYIVIHVFGFLYAYLVYGIITVFYSGGIFKIISLPLSLIGYLVFAIFPKLTSYLGSLFF